MCLFVPKLPLPSYFYREKRNLGRLQEGNIGYKDQTQDDNPYNGPEECFLQGLFAFKYRGFWGFSRSGCVKGLPQ
jgi:hypothetical protein